MNLAHALLLFAGLAAAGLAAMPEPGAPDQASTLLAVQRKYENAVAMSAQGRIVEAEAELRDIVGTCSRVFGKEHPDTPTP